jgi:hypothetical protein
MVKKALYAVMLEHSEASRGGKKRQYYFTPHQSGWSCLPPSAANTAAFICPKSQMSESGFLSASS